MQFIILDLVKIVIKSQRIIQYHQEFEVEPDVQPHSGCGLKVGVSAPVKSPPPLSNFLDLLRGYRAREMKCVLATLDVRIWLTSILSM